MEIKEVEIYSSQSNMAVLKYPGRSFPGSLIQGDSLHCLLADLVEAKGAVDSGNAQDASEILEVIIEGLTDRLDHYKKVLKEHGHQLPFPE